MPICWYLDLKRFCPAEKLNSTDFVLATHQRKIHSHAVISELLSQQETTLKSWETTNKSWEIVFNRKPGKTKNIQSISSMLEPTPNNTSQASFHIICHHHNAGVLLAEA